MSDEETSNASMDELYSTFDMNEDAEVRGVPVNFGKFVVTIARTGGSNDHYRRTMESESKPVHAALQAGLLGEQESRQLLYRVYARSVVKNWQFRENGALLIGLGRNKEGKVVEFTEQNVIALWTRYHELFNQIREAADTRELYKNREREAVAKN